jgi:uncharacterized membrane protein
MDVDVYRGWFMIGSLVLMLLAATPTLALFVRFPNSAEKFSELWLLGPNHEAEDFPFNITVNQTYKIFVGASNHLGYSASYKIYVMFRNQTQLLPDSNATPSYLPELYEYNFFVANNEVWETLLNFTILDVYRGENFTVVRNMAINNVPFNVDSFSSWDNQKKGFYYQLFFELWLYNMTAQRFQYQNRLFVGIWLNMTA